jgi:hypothetical protein
MGDHWVLVVFQNFVNYSPPSLELPLSLSPSLSLVYIGVILQENQLMELLISKGLRVIREKSDDPLKTRYF